MKNYLFRFGYRYLIIVIGMFFLNGGCKEGIDLSQVENLNGNQITALGHAGMGISSQFPINTFESFASAVALGVDGLEIDVQMTKDSVLVAFHDPSLEEKTNRTGRVFEKSWEEIEGGIYKDPLFVEYRIVTLRQVFENIANVENLIFSLDCQIFGPEKSEAHVNRLSRQLIDIIDEFDLSDQVLIEFRDTAYLKKIQELQPNLPLVMNNRNFTQALNMAMELGLYGIIGSIEDYTQAQIQTAHEQGIRVALYGLSSRADNRAAIAKYPDILQTDKVKYLVDLLN